MVARSLSFWLLIAVVVVTAIMVHPSFASLLTAPVQLGLLIALRWQARREGRAAEKALRSSLQSLRRGFV